MLRIGRERPELRVVCDQIGAPTHARDLALAVASIIRSGKAGGRGGIYHYSNEGVCSWYDFAKAIFDLSNLPVKVLPIMSKEYPTPASRPCYSVLESLIGAIVLQTVSGNWDNFRQGRKSAVKSSDV